MLAQSAGLPTSATACFSVRLTTKRTTRRAGMAAAAPVFGFRPTRARLARTCHVPKRRRITGLALLEGLLDRGQDRRRPLLPPGRWCTRVPRQSAGPAPLSACCHAPCHLASRRVRLLRSPPTWGMRPPRRGEDRAHVWIDERGQANHRQTGAVKRAAAPALPSRERRASSLSSPVPAPAAAAARGTLLSGFAGQQLGWRAAGFSPDAVEKSRVSLAPETRVAGVGRRPARRTQQEASPLLRRAPEPSSWGGPPSMALSRRCAARRLLPGPFSA